MKKISDIYSIVKESRERIIKTMQERGITELATILPYSEWCKQEECEPEEEEDDDDAYTDYKYQEAPYVVFIGKYDMNDYRIDKVTLVGDRFKFEGHSNELGYDWAWEDDTVWATRMFVWEKLEELLDIGDEPEKVWVLTNHAATECEYLGTSNRVFAKKEDALKALAEWKKDEEVYVKRYEWNVCNDTPEHYEAYEEGDYCANHTEGFINEYEVK